jgi:NADP-dependent 3-hydroxy acid dehydrogenase YdfG
LSSTRPQGTGVSKCVVVTGATGDAGRAASAALLTAGHRVVAVGSNEDRLASVEATARFVCDLTDAADTKELAERVRSELGPADALVHVVGGWRAGNGNDDWEWLEPRILTTLRLATLAFVDDLSASGAGRLVTIGSISATRPSWSGANYSVLKTAASAWVAAVASGWRKAGTAAAIEILVRAIGDDGTAPGVIAGKIVELMGENATDLNGSRVDLSV